MDIKTILGTLAQLSLAHWLIIVLLPSLSAFYWYFKKLIAAQIRYGKNLKRKVYFLKTSESKGLDTEKNTLRQLKLFNLNPDIIDISGSLKSLSLLKKEAVYIVGYSDQYDQYQKLFDSVVSSNTPIIIFAQTGEITTGHWDVFNGYIYCDVANTTNRVGMILISMMNMVPSCKP